MYYTRNHDPLGWMECGFGAYWFTIVLFQMFVIYSFANYLSLLFRKDISLLIMAVAALGVLVFIQTGVMRGNSICDILVSANLCFFCNGLF